jgi:hypothetical protein
MKKVYKKNIKLLSFLAVAFLIIVPRLALAAAWDFSTLGDLTGLPENSIKNIIEKFLLWILGIFGFLGIIGFAISGMMYLLSAGEDKRMETAKQAMQYSIIGVIVGLSGLVVIAAVDAFLSGTGDI